MGKQSNWACQFKEMGFNTGFEKWRESQCYGCDGGGGPRVVKRAGGTVRRMEEEEEDLRAREGVSMCRSSERCRGAKLWMAWKVRSRILKAMRYLKGSQWSCWRTGEMWLMGGGFWKWCDRQSSWRSVLWGNIKLLRGDTKVLRDNATVILKKVLAVTNRGRRTSWPNLDIKFLGILFVGIGRHREIKSKSSYPQENTGHHAQRSDCTS